MFRILLLGIGTDVYTQPPSFCLHQWLSGVSSVQNKPYLLQTMTGFTHFSSEVIFFSVTSSQNMQCFLNFQFLKCHTLCSLERTAMEVVFKIVPPLNCIQRQSFDGRTKRTFTLMDDTSQAKFMAVWLDSRSEVKQMFAKRPPGRWEIQDEPMTQYCTWQ